MFVWSTRRPHCKSSYGSFHTPFPGKTTR
jgi:hypothetical protein